MSVWSKRYAWVCASIAVVSSVACSSSSVNHSDDLFESDAGKLGSGGLVETGGSGQDAASEDATGGVGNKNAGGASGAGGSGGVVVDDAGPDASGGGVAGATGGAGSATGGVAGATGGAGGATGGAGGGGGTGGACVPATCPPGLCNTSISDGCGGVVTCGGCGSAAFACISNSCQLIAASACGACPPNLSLLAQIPASDDCNCNAGVMCGNPAYVVTHGFNIGCKSGSKFATSVYDCSVSQTYSVCVQ